MRRRRARWLTNLGPRHLVAALAGVLIGIWGIKLAAVTHSTARYAEHWSGSTGRTGGLLYVALGDSAAQGIGASAPEKGYVGLLAQRLRDATGRPVEVVNLSRSGARLRDVLDRQLPALAGLGRRPDVTTVAVGGNDIGRYGRETFAAEADELTTALPVGTYLADVPYFMHGRWERHAQQAAARLRASAAARDLPTVSLHEAQRAQGKSAMLHQFAADWFHPNNRGHRVWADAFWDRMRVDLTAPASGLLGTRSRPGE